jgi:hypothetical protein
LNHQSQQTGAGTEHADQWKRKKGFARRTAHKFKRTQNAKTNYALRLTAQEQTNARAILTALHNHKHTWPAKTSNALAFQALEQTNAQQTLTALFKPTKPAKTSNALAFQALEQTNAR